MPGRDNTAIACLGGGLYRLGCVRTAAHRAALCAGLSAEIVHCQR